MTRGAAVGRRGRTSLLLLVVAALALTDADQAGGGSAARRASPPSPAGGQDKNPEGVRLAESEQGAEDAIPFGGFVTEVPRSSYFASTPATPGSSTPTSTANTLTPRPRPAPVPAPVPVFAARGARDSPGARVATTVGMKRRVDFNGVGSALQASDVPPELIYGQVANKTRTPIAARIINGIEVNLLNPPLYTLHSRA